MRRSFPIVLATPSAKAGLTECLCLSGSQFATVTRWELATAIVLLADLLPPAGLPVVHLAVHLAARPAVLHYYSDVFLASRGDQTRSP